MVHFVRPGVNAAPHALQILEALQEARQQPPAPAWGNLKKAELAALAAREIAATGWLPAPLRQIP